MLINKLLLLSIFAYILFFHIKDDEYTKMFGLMVIIGLTSHIVNKQNETINLVQIDENDIIERFPPGEEGTGSGATDDPAGDDPAGDDPAGDDPASDDPASDDPAGEGEDETDTTAATAGDTEIEESDVVAANTPFVSAEYVKLQEKAEAEQVTDENDTPEGDGPTDPIPSSSDSDFEEKDPPTMTAFEKNFRIGPYDGLCISSDKFKDEDIVPNEELKTYFGVQGPIQVISSQDVLVGPTVDGEKDSPQKLSMFANNKTSFNCCGESPFTTSTGCICLTDKQREYLRSRGFNKNSFDL